ncbi:hypothetical protein Pcinc_002134 [Petrolisthes cinctipes]|uniref:Uncharacterized protein n=1 Tax=Petrolisthes cinctipes TaxID=88211 RepID=A0AAE1GLN7_PETCI|nr:hypothetical protein Pcinc_002134 [Petrolisthes cinctipes]
MELKKNDSFARTVLYSHILEYYRFEGGQWKPRKRGTYDQENNVHKGAQIGRIYAVSPGHRTATTFVFCFSTSPTTPHTKTSKPSTEYCTVHFRKHVSPVASS